MSFVVFNDSNGVSCFNFSANLRVEFKKVSFTFSKKVKQKMSDNYGDNVFHGTFDTCKVNSDFLSNRLEF